MTINDVWKTFTNAQKNRVYRIIESILDGCDPPKNGFRPMLNYNQLIVLNYLTNKVKEKTNE